MNICVWTYITLSICSGKSVKDWQGERKRQGAYMSRPRGRVRLLLPMPRAAGIKECICVCVRAESEGVGGWVDGPRGPGESEEGDRWESIVRGREPSGRLSGPLPTKRIRESVRS
jgi:hypothetical protein